MHHKKLATSNIFKKKINRGTKLIGFYLRIYFMWNHSLKKSNILICNGWIGKLVKSCISFFHC